MTAAQIEEVTMTRRIRRDHAPVAIGDIVQINKEGGQCGNQAVVTEVDAAYGHGTPLGISVSPPSSIYLT